ncbi:TPA: hydroxymethylpyrimidine/phosphomethylpyrimidine kinase, partial [Candidatus Bathyarchaeota archaeon]|nr:hydroxymethylpyrimidine/phosphomethylpyrimidine kinase [Candidatus Bathyarchaeota archaeon]
MITRCALTIAGSDSSGGAGIQADLKAFAALGVHGACVVTAITAQSTAGIDDITGVSPGMVRDQIRAVLRDLRVDAVKVGMLYSDGTVEVVAQEIKGHRFPVIVDPVLVAGCGVPLLMPEALAPFKELMVPLATVITPNVYEAEALTGIAVREPSDAVKAAEALTGLGAGSVVVKGG